MSDVAELVKELRAQADEYDKTTPYMDPIVVDVCRRAAAELERLELAGRDARYEAAANRRLARSLEAQRDAALELVREFAGAHDCESYDCEHLFQGPVSEGVCILERARALLAQEKPNE